MADYRKYAEQKARQYSLPVPVFLAQIGQESGWNPNARSSAGAQGIAQFIPSTAKAYGLTNPFDPLASIDAAARYDSDLLKRYGSPERMLSAYNSGRPDAYKDPAFAKGQTYRYVRSILGGVPSGGAATPASATAATISAPQASPQPVPSAGGPSPIAAALSMLGFAAPAGAFSRAAAPIAAPRPSAAAPVTPSRSTGGLAIPIRGNIGSEAPSFLSALTAAAKARGAVAIEATSGERSVAHNAEIHGATHSNHLPDEEGNGHAMDGYAILRDGSRVPLGQFLKPNAASFGLRSGATFNWGGGPDLVHVDDFHNGGR